MSKSMVTVTVNNAKITSRLSTGNAQAQKWLDNEVLKDSAPYVPRRTGDLEKSGISGTAIGSGTIVYNMPYARRQYYGDYSHSKQAHPKATRLWFEVAKAANKAKWLLGVKKLGGGE